MKTIEQGILAAAVFGLLLATSSLQAQAIGVVQGQVIDNVDGKPIFGVTVIVQGQNKFAQTDFDGKYQIQLPPGTYTLVYQMATFENRTRQVTVQPGQAVNVNVAMGTPAATQAEVVVTDRALNNTEASLLALQKKSGSTSDGISAEAIKKSPDSDAGDVLKRVTGITLVGGKYVFVRGLGERYSNTILNGHTLPSPEPDKRVVPMDLFPASLIKNIRIIKTFLPEDSAEFSGGLVKVETKEYPDEFLVTVGLGLGTNSQTTGKTFQSLPRGGNDYLGLGPNDFFGFGSDRWKAPGPELPGILPLVPGTTVGGIPEGLVQITAAQFNGNWSPKGIKAPVDRSLNFSIGNSINIFDDMKFGFLYGTSYSRKWRTKNIAEYRYISVPAFFQDASGDSDYTYLVPKAAQIGKAYTEEVLWGNNLNLALRLNPSNEIYSKTFYSTQSDKEYRSVLGTLSGSSNLDFIDEVSSYVAREIMSETVGGRHAIQYTAAMRPHEITWSYNYSEAGRDQPDQRSRNWSRGQGSSDPFLSSNTDGRRYFSEAEDKSKSFKIDYELPYEQWNGLQAKLKIGYQNVDRTKDFGSRQFFYQSLSGSSADGVDVYPIPGEVTFNPARIFAGKLRFSESVLQNNSYAAEQKLDAYYMQTDLPVTSNLRIVGGARVENSFQKTRTYKSDNPTAKPYYGCGVESYSYFRAALIRAGICDLENNGVGIEETSDILPSVNVVYEVIKDMNLRMAYTETVSRPDLRELSKFSFTPYFGADIKIGNPDLNRTYIHNYDFRWEWYLTATEYVGAGFFYKHLSQPIEEIGRPLTASGNREFTYANAQEGQIRGIELDFRKDFLERFRAEANLFFIRSRVTIMPWIQRTLINMQLVDPLSPEAFYRPSQLERELQGQSNLVYNVKLSYFINEAKTMSIGTYINYFSDRIQVAGSEGTPDVVEKGQTVVDLVYQWEPTENLDLKASIKNLTREKFESVHQVELLDAELPYNSYDRGMDFSVSASYKF